MIEKINDIIHTGSKDVSIPEILKYVVLRKATCEQMITYWDLSKDDEKEVLVIINEEYNKLDIPQYKESLLKSIEKKHYEDIVFNNLHSIS